MNDKLIKEYSDFISACEWNGLTEEQKLWAIRRAGQAIEDLKGTCRAEFEAVNDAEDDFIAHYGQIELGEVFTDLLAYESCVREVVRCECCDWWVPMHEITSNNYCTDCDGDNEDE